MIKINSEASIKIYDHIHCIGIIQNFIFFIIMQGRDSVAENRYNDSPIVMTIQYISQFFSKFSVRRNELKVNRVYRYVTLYKALQWFNTLTQKYSKFFVSRNKLKLT
jgi:hypothetical protein